MLLCRCSGCAPRQVGSCGFGGLEVTKVTSKSEDLRLQGDQPHRGLCSTVGGIQKISPIEDYHQVGGIKSRDGHFREELVNNVPLVTIMPLCCSLQRRNHGWGGYTHFPGIMIVAEEQELALGVYATSLWRTIWWPNTGGVTKGPK